MAISNLNPVATLLIFYFYFHFRVEAIQTQSPTFLQVGEECLPEEKRGLGQSSRALLTVYDDLGVNINNSLSQINNAALTNGTSKDGMTFLCDPNVPLECLAGRCQCKKGYTINRNGTRCLEVARNGLESNCEENIQCWKGLLGRMSECNLATGKCQCYESETLTIVFHRGR